VGRGFCWIIPLVGEALVGPADGTGVGDPVGAALGARVDGGTGPLPLSKGS
jgi:hypothetical protein